MRREASSSNCRVALIARPTCQRRVDSPVPCRAPSCLGPRADPDQVLLLEARLLGRATVPLVAEGVHCFDELGLLAVLACVRLGGDRRAVLRLEVLAVVMWMLEGSDRQVFTSHRAEADGG